MVIRKTQAAVSLPPHQKIVKFNNIVFESIAKSNISCNKGASASEEYSKV